MPPTKRAAAPLSVPQADVTDDSTAASADDRLPEGEQGFKAGQIAPSDKYGVYRKGFTDDDLEVTDTLGDGDRGVLLVAAGDTVSESAADRIAGK